MRPTVLSGRSPLQCVTDVLNHLCYRCSEPAPASECCGAAEIIILELEPSPFPVQNDRSNDDNRPAKR
jgi:hypothetical protein